MTNGVAAVSTPAAGAASTNAAGAFSSAMNNAKAKPAAAASSTGPAAEFAKQLLTPQAGVVAVQFSYAGKGILAAALPSMEKIAAANADGWSEKSVGDVFRGTTIFIALRHEDGTTDIATGNYGSGTLEVGKPYFGTRELNSHTLAFGNIRGGLDQFATSSVGSVNTGIIVSATSSKAQKKMVAKLEQEVVQKLADDFAKGIDDMVDGVPLVGRSPLGYIAKKAGMKAAREFVIEGLKKSLSGYKRSFVGVAWRQQMNINPNTGEISLKLGNSGNTYTKKATEILPEVTRMISDKF